MWRRAALYLALVVLALALVIVPGVIVIVGQTGWARQRVHETMARELADYLGREVAVGPVSGSFLDGFVVDGLAIAEGQRLSDGAVVTARRVGVEYDLWSVLCGRLSPLASISAVHVYGPQVRVVRDAQGRLNLARLIPRVRALPLHKRFRGRVFLHEGAVAYTDHAKSLRAPLTVRADSLEVSVDLRRVVRVAFQATGRMLDDRAGRFSVTAQVHLDRLFTALDLSLDNVDVPWLTAHCRQADRVRILSGRADLRGSVYVVRYRGTPSTDASFTLGLRNLRLATPTAGAVPVSLDGNVWVSPGAVQARGVRATVAGSVYDVTGSVANFSAPQVDLALESRAARLEPLWRALPASVRGASAFPRGGVGSLQAQVIGPAGNPDVRLKLDTGDPLTLKLAQLGAVRAEGLQLSADVVSATAQPSVRATVGARRLQVPAVKLSASALPWKSRSVALGPMRGFHAVVQYCGGKPLARGFVQTPYVRVGDTQATGVSTHVTLVNDLLRLQKLRAKALGGSVEAEAACLLSKAHEGVRARGTVHALDLARLQEIPGLKLPDDLAGVVNADFQAHVTRERFVANAAFDATELRAEKVAAATASGIVGIEGDGELRGLGRITAEDIRREDIALDRLEALVRFGGGRVELLSGYARSAEGLAWARGELDLDARTLRLRVQGADLAAGALAERAGIKDAAGRGYATGEVTGPFDRPVFTGRVMLFEPRLGKYTVAAATAHARLEGDRLALTHLMATRGAGVVSGDLTLDNLRGPREEIALDGHLTGEALDLKDMAELCEQDRPVAGVAEFSAQVSGTVDHPHATGQLRLVNATYKDFPVSRVEAPFVLEDDRLRVAQAQATVLDTPVEARGTITFGEKPQVDAYLSAGGVRLEGLAPYLETPLSLAGRVSVERIWVRGPTDDLHGGAHITAQQVAVGDETIGDLDATLSLARGRVQLQETSFAVGRGVVVVSGAYDTASDPDTITARARLSHTAVPALLNLAVPIAEALDERPERNRERLLLSLRSYALRLAGAVDGTVTVEGPVNAPTAVANVAGQELALDGRALPQITAQGRVGKEAIHDLVLAARQGDALVNADGDIVFDGPISLNLEGTGIAMAQLRPWLRAKASLAGQLGFTIVAEGQTKEPDLTGSVDIAAPNFAGIQFDVLSVPVATVREGAIDVDTLTLKRGETQIVLDGRLPFSWHLQRESGTRPGLIPDGQITMGGRIENTPLAFFLPLIDEYMRGQRPPAPTPTAETGFQYASLKTEGKVNSAVSLTGTVENPTVRGFLKLDDGMVQPPQWARALSDLKADVRFSGAGHENTVEIQTLTGRYDQTRADLTGRIGVKTTAPQDFWRNALDLKLALAADKQPLPGGTEVSAVSGALRLRTEGGLQVLRPEDLRARIGGGEAELTGEARFRDFRIARLAMNQYNLQFKMSPGRLRYRPYLDAMAHGTIALATPQGGTRARISGNWQLADGVVGLEAPAAGIDTFKAVSSAWPDPDLDLVAGLGDGLEVRGSAIKAPLRPNPTAAHITGTPQRPLLVGDITTGRGTTMLPTATLRLRTLVVHYFVEPVPGERSDPQTLRLRGTIDGNAETTVSRPGASPIRIQVRISGNLPDQVAITTSSDPPLTETQIYALLGGVPFSYLPGVGGGSGGVGQIVSEQFLAALGNVFKLRVFEPIEAELQKMLGLELGITFAFNQPVTLQVGKYVLRNLFITYERPLVESVERFDLRVSYELPHGLRITYHNDERDINQVEIGYSFMY